MNEIAVLGELRKLLKRQSETTDALLAEQRETNRLLRALADSPETQPPAGMPPPPPR